MTTGGERMINLVLALKSEAKPLIEHFKLAETVTDTGARLFEGSGLSLVIGGIGKAAATAAVTTLSVRSSPQEEQVWINLGLAGHRTHEVGRAFLAHSVEDAQSGEIWRPRPIVDADLPTVAVQTVERPELDYPEDCLYDMEASAFMAAVSRRPYADLIQVMKIVSDNRKRPTRQLTAQLAVRLVRQQLPAIERLISEIRLRSISGGDDGNVS